MIINHNIAALNTHRQMGSAQSAQMNSMEKLSSGLRINSAKDDAAGLTISEKMRGQIRGLEQGSRNAQDGISMIQTAEGTLSVTQDILQRMRELAVQSANDTNTTEDRDEIQKEVTQLTAEITRIGNETEFNSKKLLDGSASGVNFQIGANMDQQLSTTFEDMRSAALDISNAAEGANVTTTTASFGGNAGSTFTYKDPTDATQTITEYALNVSTSALATSAIEVLDTAIKSVSSERSKLGATQNRLEYTIDNLNTSSENLTAAESRIRDVDYAEAA